jgi:hypothetical protein
VSTPTAALVSFCSTLHETVAIASTAVVPAISSLVSIFMDISSLVVQCWFEASSGILVNNITSGN